MNAGPLGRTAQSRGTRSASSANSPGTSTGHAASCATACRCLIELTDALVASSTVTALRKAAGVIT